MSQVREETKKQGMKHAYPGHKGRKEMFYLTSHSTYFIYGYMTSNMVNGNSAREKTHMGYSF